MEIEKTYKQNILVKNTLNSEVGIVVAISDYIKQNDIVKLNEEVFFKKTAGVNIKFEDNNFILLSETELLGKVKDSNIKLTVEIDNTYQKMMDFFERNSMKKEEMFITKSL